MFEYKYVRIEFKQDGLQKKPTEDHREIIERHAKEGWRLIQIFSAPNMYAIGYPNYLEIILEKNVN